ncbi:hypothetical protein VIGAN_02172500 [Vigna angularis var. angularis]|uniref:Uncharacterized protein n=1 Tax=Vigna angularis var. angularis TaxID=157739 RepID=A0A0S3REV8_PHAAN|nr:hypothetical protein VIGAN_02172500 [Vigna angularis var. angularis]
MTLAAKIKRKENNSRLNYKALKTISINTKSKLQFMEKMNKNLNERFTKPNEKTRTSSNFILHSSSDWFPSFFNSLP